MNTSIREHFFTRKNLGIWSLVLLGSVIMSTGFVLFINPYNIVPGGVYGLGVVFHYIFPDVQVGTFGLLFDIPLLLIGLKVFGRMFGAKTIVAALMIPVVMNTMTNYIGSNPETMFGGNMNLINDMFLACIFGGVLIGAGLGLIIKTHATSGGTDIVAMLLSKYAKLTFSKGMLLVDSMVVIFGVIILGDWRLPLYSLVTIFVTTRAIDYMIDGASYDKLLFIISEKRDSIKDYILEDMGRGGTFIRSSGMYTAKEKEMIFVVVSRSEVSMMQKKIHEIDKDAFVVVVNAYETFGDGFKSFPEKS